MERAQLIATSILEPVLEKISNDYQLDQNDDRFVGFLNTSPKEEWSYAERMALVYMIEHQSLALFDLLEKYEMDVEDGPTEYETIFLRLKR
jgi:hypothetical protein